MLLIIESCPRFHTEYFMAQWIVECTVCVQVCATVCMPDANLKWAGQRNIHFPSQLMAGAYSPHWEKSLFPHIAHSRPFFTVSRAQWRAGPLSCGRWAVSQFYLSLSLGSQPPPYLSHPLLGTDLREALPYQNGYSEILKCMRRLCEKVVMGWLLELLRS